MKAIGISRLGWVWAILVAATCVSWETTEDDILRSGHVAASFVLLVAFFKVYLIAEEFMELRHAPTAFRLAAKLWIVATGAGLMAVRWWVPL